jgi:hypothetical protein
VSTPGRIEVPKNAEGEPIAWLVKDANGNRIDNPNYRYEIIEGKRYLVVDDLEPDIPAD